MRGLAASATAVVLLLLAPGAAATQRFAAPAGTGSECTQPAPCSLAEAVGAAKAADEVIVTPGTYNAGGPIFLPAFPNVQVHGEAGAPMPKVLASFGGPVFYLLQTGDSLSYMEVENDSNSGVGLLCIGSKVERVKVKAIGSNAAGAAVESDCLLRNSLFRVEGMSSAALRGAGVSTLSTVSARNVTAIATGTGSAGVIAQYNEGTPGEFTFQVLNSIVQGGEADLKPESSVKGPGNILAANSNFDSSKAVGEAKVIDGGGNQTAAPIFVNAEIGDYHEAAGSPTIDAGLAGELGPFDLDGAARVQGPAPDIGAYEFVPQPPAEGGIRSLSIKPKRFRARKSGGSVAKGVLKSKPPVGAAVTYEMTGAATVSFSVSRKLKHGGRYGPVKGSFSRAAVDGKNRFVFSGRIGGRTLKPGKYKLTGFAGHLVSASFVIAAGQRPRRHHR